MNTDIQLNDWLHDPHAMLHPARQCEIAVPGGLAIIPQVSIVPMDANDPHGPAEHHWVNDDQLADRMRFHATGPSQPNDMGFPEVRVVSRLNMLSTNLMIRSDSIFRRRSCSFKEC